LYGDPTSLGDKSIVAVTATLSSRISGYSGLNQIPARAESGMMLGSTFLSDFGVNLTEWYLVAGLTILFVKFLTLISTGTGANKLGPRG